MTEKAPPGAYVLWTRMRCPTCGAIVEWDEQYRRALPAYLDSRHVGRCDCGPDWRLRLIAGTIAMVDVPEEAN